MSDPKQLGEVLDDPRSRLTLGAGKLGAWGVVLWILWGQLSTVGDAARGAESAAQANGTAIERLTDRLDDVEERTHQATTHDVRQDAAIASIEAVIQALERRLEAIDRDVWAVRVDRQEALERQRARRRPTKQTAAPRGAP